MEKPSTKHKIITHAARIIRRKGFNNTGIQEILESAKVPKGSFYFYFKSKDELGLALIDYYGQFFASMSAPLKNTETSPLRRLEQFFEGFRLLCERDEWKSGCPIGNLTQEMGVLSEAFQTKLKAVLDAMKASIRECLEQAQESNEISDQLNADEIADFILNSWEGAFLRMKAEGNTGPLILFQNTVFGILLPITSWRK
jgi:TetR/AcrR family transcriptional regulator, transcriptional repressor for nem operon